MLIQKLPHLKGLILDMDGVLWRGKQPIGDLPKIFDLIAKMGLRAAAVTNNATTSIEEYQQKFSEFGIPIERERIVTSATVSVSYMQNHFAQGTPVYVVGSPSLMEMVRTAGFRVTNAEQPEISKIVIAGMDRQLSYERIDIASRLIRNGACFIATNNDATFPVPGGLQPGAGVTIAAIQTASGVTPMVMGKPQPYPYQTALRRLQLDAAEVMGVGDRLSTDIAGAQAAGCLSGFVCSGVDTRTDAENWQPQIDLIAGDLWSLLNA